LHGQYLEAEIATAIIKRIELIDGADRSGNARPQFSNLRISAARKI
jgi:hypothetical protein